MAAMKPFRIFKGEEPGTSFVGPCAPPDADVAYDTTVRDGVLVVTFVGKLTRDVLLAEPCILKAFLNTDDRLQPDGFRSVRGLVFDLTGLQWANSNGVALINQLRASFAVVHPSTPVTLVFGTAERARSVFTVTQLLPHVFAEGDTVEAAIASYQEAEG